MEQIETEQRDFISALKEADEIDLTVTGRVSGRKSTRPVWFVHENNKVYLVPVNGADTEWYKNARKNPAVTLTVDGLTRTAKARPITDRAEVSEIVDKFRAKYGAGEIKKYYSKLDVAVEVPLGGTEERGARSPRTSSSRARSGGRQ